MQIRSTTNQKRHLSGITLRPVSKEALQTISCLLGDPLEGSPAPGVCFDTTSSSSREVVQGSAGLAGRATPILESSASPWHQVSGEQPFSPLSSSSGQSISRDSSSAQGGTVVAASFQPFVPIRQHNLNSESTEWRHSRPVVLASVAGQVCTLPPP